MPTAFLVCAFWWLVWWVVREHQRGATESLDGVVEPRPWAHLGVGIGVGIVAMMVANILFLIPLVLAGIFLAPRRTVPAGGGGVDEAAAASAVRPRWRLGRRARASAALLLLGIGLGTAPCWLHNYVVARDPVALSAHSGLNFWVGNSPVANGYPRIPPGLSADQQGLLRDSIALAERAAGRPLTRAEVSAYWTAKAHAYIVEHPGAWARLLALKLRNFWSAFQYDDLSVITSLQEDGVLLPGLSFGILAALGLPGLWLAARRAPAARWVVAAVLLHMASLLPVFVTERYRLAAVPGLCLVGAYGLYAAWRAIRARQHVFCAIYAAALLAAATFAFWPVTDQTLLTLDDYNTAVADLDAYDLAAARAAAGEGSGAPDPRLLERARVKLERVYAISPWHAETLFALGNLWLAKGERTRAKSFYRQTLEQNGEHSRALNNLGVLAIEEKRWALAEAFLTRALEIDADNAKTFYLLAEARFQTHNRAGASAAIEHAVRLRPDQPRFLALRDQIAATAATTTTATP